MGESTAIAWTDHTFNPWWGCQRVSPGCANCYAETFAHRLGLEVWGKSSDRRRFADKHWDGPRKWDRAAAAADRPALVFCASMADVFEDRDDHLEDRARLFDLIETTPHLIWQLLTKRPENAQRLVPEWWRSSQWPSNVWLGTTVEDQIRALDRIPSLLATGARVRFLSCEPLLEELDLKAHWLRPTFPGPHIDWVICGGESGPGHRPLDLRAARALRRQCYRQGVPFFFKQVGGRTHDAGGDLLDGELLKSFPRAAGDRGGVDVEVRR